MIGTIQQLARRAAQHSGAEAVPPSPAQTKLGLLVQVLSQQISSQSAGPFGAVIVQAANFLARKLEATPATEQERWSRAIVAIAVALADPLIDLDGFRDRLGAVLDDAFRADDGG